MKRNAGFLCWLLLMAGMVACTDIYRESDEWDEEEEIKPPSETYHHEDDKEYCLNVMYYVPSDVVDVEDWHYRLSGMTLKIQEYFDENFGYYSVDRKMGLVVNDSSESYIRVHYLKSQYPVAEMHEGNIGKMAQEVLDWYAANPTEKTSDHYLVWMPDYEGGFIKHYFPDAKSGMAFAAVDNDRWKASYFESARATAVFLSDFGAVLKTFAHSLFLPESNGGLENAYMSLMGANERTGSNIGGLYSPLYNYTYYTGSGSGKSVTYGTPDKVRLMVWDVRYLSGTQLFNDECSYEPFEVTVDKENVRIWSKDTACSTAEGLLYDEWWKEDTIWMEVPFQTNAELAGVLLLDDTWVSWQPLSTTQDTTLDRDPMEDTGWNAYGVYLDATALTDNGGGNYVAKFTLPCGNHLYPFTEGLKPTAARGAAFITKHELRLRFIGRNGMAYPHYPTSVKGDTPNWESDEPIDSPYRYPYKYLYRSTGTSSWNSSYYPYVSVPWDYDGWLEEEGTEPSKPE